uniref:RING-type E3 ubiquitin transferase n=1 Tax=Anopheles culicifacies TaxID=139723 RepID=A0A182M074_9DIPT
MDALVENAAAPPSRFYCHSCAIEIDRVSSEFTCPHCLEGFIEELPAVERSGSAGSAVGQDAEQPSNDYDNPQFSSEANGESASGVSVGNGEHALFTLEDIPMDGSSGPLPGVPIASGTSTAGADMGEGAASSSSGGGGDTRPSFRFSGRRGSRRRGVQNFNNVDQMLREILISVSGGANGAGAGGPMFFMGNPGDYAWGREGIDTIVTQLLNQMDNTGPPPLEKERIAQIPIVTINEEQVERKLQCSVCFEDFVVGESVRKLPCLHVYHDPCIIPWLELHGTCPICRNSLSPEDTHGGAQSQSQDSAQSQSDNSQQTAQPQSDSGRQNSNFLTFTIRMRFKTPTYSVGDPAAFCTQRIRPAMTNLLFEMGQPLAATAATVSSSLPPSASGSGASSGAGTGTTPNGDASTASRSNAAAGGTSTSGGNGSQTSNSQRDEDGTIDYTLELD